MTTITLRQPDDMHCHLRTGSLLREVLPYTAGAVRRAIVMPNTRPRAILEKDDVIQYRDEICRALEESSHPSPFEPLMTIEIRDSTTPQMVVDASRAGAVAGKVYPFGVTTNSDQGLHDFSSRQITETFRAMQAVGMRLLLHGELDGERTLVTEREAAFLPILVNLAQTFPDLKIVLEHVSTRAGVTMVQVLGKNVAATITAHHLCLTLNDVIGAGLQPHHGCMPMPKGFDDRDALIVAATSGSPQFFLGSDSAPHPRQNKECAKGACGVYSAPVLVSVLAAIFEEAGALGRLEDFTSRFGAEFYGLPLNTETITLQKTNWLVPQQIGSVVPFRAGETLAWQLEI